MLETAPIEPKVRHPAAALASSLWMQGRSSFKRLIVRPRQAIFPALAILSIHRQHRGSRHETLPFRLPPNAVFRLDKYRSSWRLYRNSNTKIDVLGVALRQIAS